MEQPLINKKRIGIFKPAVCGEPLSATLEAKFGIPLICCLVGMTGGKVLTMAIKLINIGFGNIVSANRIISIVSPESAPIKRIIQEARDRHMLIDATYGRRTRAVIITDSDHVILSAVQPETVAHRLSTKDDEHDE